MKNKSLHNKNIILLNTNLVLLFCIFIFYVIYFPMRAYSRKYITTEQFENDKSVIDEDIYIKFYNKVFNQEGLFQSNINKVSRFIDTKNKVKILDVGCGSGRHYELLNKKYKDIVGVDKSNSFIKWAKIRNGEGTFIVDDFKITNLFPPAKFSHITCFLETIYHNKEDEMDLIFKNFHYWLNDNGFLFINLFLKDVLDPAPREFSQHYFDENKTKHSITYFENFTHDAWWDIKGNDCKYHEEFINKDGKSFLKIHDLTIPNEDEMVKKITNNGFEVVDMLKYDDIDMSDMMMLVCRKK